MKQDLISEQAKAVAHSIPIWSSVFINGADSLATCRRETRVRRRNFMEDPEADVADEVLRPTSPAQLPVLSVPINAEDHSQCRKTFQ